jgi:hypothetical protein
VPESAAVVAWLMAEATPPATVIYPAIVRTQAGNAMGTDNTEAPMDASVRLILRTFLKNVGVGDCTLCNTVIMFCF